MAQNPAAALLGVFGSFLKPLQQQGFSAFSNPALFLAPAANHLLARDADCQRRLKSQSNKVLELRATPVVVRLKVTDAGFFEPAAPGVPADTTIAVELKDALPALRDRQKAMSATSIEGDAELAATVSYLLEHLRWDPEDDLAQVVGDERAVMAMRFFSQVVEGVLGTGQRLSEATREYMLHEQAIAVGQTDMDRFVDEVSRLRDDLARLEKRVQRLDTTEGGA